MSVCRPSVFALLIAALAASGCTSMHTDRRQTEMRQHSQVQNLQADLRRLQGRVEGLATAQEDAYRQIEGIRETVSGRDAELERQLREVSDALAATAAAREAMKNDIVATVTRNMQEVLKRQAPPVAQYAQRGVEHTVESGQTLSAIAAAYGVTTRVLVEANNLPNPDNLRAGQKLFIPE